MKKFSIITAAFLLMGMLFGSQAMAQGRIDFRTNSAQQCANVTEDGFTATFSFSGIQANEMNTEKGVFSNITMDGTYPSGNVGEPSLPAAHQLIAVPYGVKNVTVEVKNYSTTTYRLADYGIKTLMPQQASVSKSQKPEDVKFAYNEKAYAAKSMSQRPVATLEIQGTLRGIQVGSLTINPVNYNPATNSIEVYNDIEIEVRYDNYDKSASYNEFARTFSPYFASVYKTMFNWRDDVYDQHPDLWQAPVKMLVIADRMFEECMQEWLEWKTMKGYYLDVNYTDEIGNSASAVRSFIQSKYAENAPTFVIIFGDKNQVAASATGSETQCVTDLQYMSVDNDDFPDIYHSRMCAENVQQMQNIIWKTLWYEKLQFETPSRNTDYLGNVLLIAGWDSYWTSYDGAPSIQYALEYYYNTEHGFNNIYYWLGQPYTGCYAPMSSGVGFVNYTAHGSNTSWADPSFTVSDVNNLTNENMPFLAMGNCCQAADWGINSTCLGEAMIRANTRAAFAYIGSCPSTYWYEDYYFTVGATNVFGQMPTYEQTAYGLYDAVWNDAEFNCVSALPFIGNIAVCYAHAGNYQGSVSDKYYWQSYHALGDGSVMPFRIEPTVNNVSHMPTLPIGLDYFNISAEPGSYAAISMDGVLYGAGLIGPEGSTDIAIEPILSGGDVTICVTGLDKIPYIATIPAASLDGAYIVYNDVQCENLNYGAFVNPTVTLKNVGVQTANNVTVTLSTNSPYIDILNNTTTVASIAPDATVDINDFTFEVGVDIPDQTRVQFFVTCVSGTDSWESKFNLTFNAPKFVTNNVFNTDLTPGGNGTATFQITNIGHADAENAIFEVYASSDDLTLGSNVYEIGTFAVGATNDITVDITVGSNVEIGSTYELSYLMTAGHYSVEGSYIITVGNIIESFETGDFSAYDWQFGGAANWTVVNNESHTGTYCAKSGAIQDQQQTDLILTAEVRADGEISFFVKVSSESGYDKLHFYIDNQEKGDWSGNEGWSEQSYPVSAGTHTFKWSYTKDYSVSSGSDCAWLDDIKFPPTNVELALDPVTNLVATVDGNTVELTWTASPDATLYAIRRNGEPVSSQSGTSFTDNVADGIYTYSVVACNADHYSSAAYVTVSVGTVGVEENTFESLSIYPNPVNSTLNVDCGNTDFDYAMFNGMGQMVAKGNANGNTQINVSDLNKGVYFLRLTNGTQVRVEKIVVE